MLYGMAEKMGELPPALKAMPQLEGEELWYLEHFHRLTKDRNYTDAGPLPLTTSQIYTYYRVFELFGFDDFYEWLVMIDGIYLESVAEKRMLAERNRPKPVNKPPGIRRSR